MKAIVMKTIEGTTYPGQHPPYHFHTSRAKPHILNVYLCRTTPQFILNDYKELKKAQGEK